MLWTTRYASLLGPLTLAADGEHIVGLWLEGQKYFAATLGGDALENPDPPVFALAAAWLDAYFAGENPSRATLPLAPAGSDFRRTVWNILCEIPYGRCATYGEIARKTAARLGRRSMSSRAVGGAIGHNPISIIIPCHRVIGAGGNMTGYAGGIQRKAWLLEHEGADISGFSRQRHGFTGRQPCDP